MGGENITLAPLIVLYHRMTMKLLKIFLLASVTLFFATNYAEAQTASGGTDEVSDDITILHYVGFGIGLIGFYKLTFMPKKDGRTKSGYKDNADPLRIKSRLIGLVMLVLGAAIFLWAVAS